MSDGSAITWPYTHTFAKPALVAGDEIRELVLNEPTTADLLEFGVFDGAFHGRNIIAMVAKLSGNAPSIIERLPGVETLKLATRLSGFFGQAAR
jgi:hypothetical protein